jgi:uncharacterized protein
VRWWWWGAARGGRGVRDLLGRALDRRLPLLLLIVILVIPPLLAAVAVAAHALIGGPSFALLLPPLLLPPTVVFLFLFGGSVQEEFGWTLALDRLLRQWPPLPAAIGLGAIWGVWHLPLFWTTGVAQAYLPFWSFLVFTIASRVLFTAAYLWAGRNLLVHLLCHTAVNLSLGMFPLIAFEPGRAQGGWLLYVALFVMVTAVTVLFDIRRPVRRSIFRPVPT